MKSCHKQARAWLRLNSDHCSARTRADVNVQMADSGDSVLVGSCHTHHIVARLLVLVRRHCIAVGGEFDGVAIRLNLDLGAAVTEVPDFFAGGRVERADFECDGIAGTNAAGRVEVRVNRRHETFGVLTIDNDHHGKIV